MSEALYIRLRGRVLGPFDEEKLRSLARRGQLSRLHQLSPDGTNWVPASSYPDLFVAGDGQTTAMKQPAAPKEEELAFDFQQAESNTVAPQDSGKQAGPPADGAWHYEINGQEKGPVSRAVVMDLISSGRIQPTNQVWAEGMPSWTAASQVSDFAPLFDAQNSGESSRGGVVETSSQDLPAELCRMAQESKPWVMTIGIIVMVYAVLIGISAFMLMINGAQLSFPPLVVAGITYLVIAVLVGVAGFMLLSFSGRLGALQYNRAPIILERALRLLKAFWTYIAILMLVSTALTILVVIWSAAVVETLPSGF